MDTSKLDFSKLLEQSLDELERHFSGEDSGVETHTYVLGEMTKIKIDHIMVKTIREELHATQKEFAYILGVSTRTVEAWESDRSHPNGSASRLMQLILSSSSIRMLFQTALDESKKKSTRQNESKLKK